MAPEPSMFTQALAYAKAGVSVFPCVPGEKRPLATHGFHDASTDPDQIRAWWTATPNANIATPTGHPGFDVLDVDVRPGGSGWEALLRLQEVGLLHGWIRSIRTPSGGVHLHYPGTDQRNGSLRRSHVDFRGLGGYVLLPPSLIRTQEYARRYELMEIREYPGRSLDWTSVNRLLEPRIPPNPAPPPRGLDPISWLAAHVARQSEGNRDSALFWAACRAAEAGVPDLTPLVDAAVGAGLPERQARRTVRSAQDTIAHELAGPAPRPHPGRLPPNSSLPPIRSAS